jgi:hypothetical protein
LYFQPLKIERKTMPKLVTITQVGNKYLAVVDGGHSFEVGRRVTYAARGGQTIGLAGSLGATDKYNPDDFFAQFGVWAYFIAPTALCESNGHFATLNSYDIASFTWSFLQFGAHVPNGDFVIYFRKLLTDPGAVDYFPDLVLSGNRICRVEPSGSVPLETDLSTQALMNYLNPTIQAVEDVEVVNAAKLVDWTMNSPSARLLQVDAGVALFRANMKAYAQRYGLDGTADFVCLVVADIRHQGRGSSSDILQALATGGNQQKAYDNLIQIGNHLYAPRCKTLDTAVKAFIQAGKLGTSKYSVSKSDFVPN